LVLKRVACPGSRTAGQPHLRPGGSQVGHTDLLVSVVIGACPLRLAAGPVRRRHRIPVIRDRDAAKAARSGRRAGHASSAAPRFGLHHRQSHALAGRPVPQFQQRQGGRGVGTDLLAARPGLVLIRVGTHAVRGAFPMSSAATCSPSVPGCL